MRYGYMPSIFEDDLLSEIAFAKKHFDFVEITLKPNRKEYCKGYLARIKSALKGFEVLGHMHWEIDLSENNPRELKKACESVRMLKAIGAKRITIHPSKNRELGIKKLLQNNSAALWQIKKVCTKNRILLLMENTTKQFGRASNIKKLVGNIPDLALTLDTGHAIRSSKTELRKFLGLGDKIQHIHLHDTVNNSDHLFFQNRAKLRKFVQNIRKSGYDKTITLEMFFALRNKKPISIQTKERRKLLLKQLDFIRN